METTATVHQLRQADSVEDPLTELARDGARRMIAAAMHAEIDEFVARFEHLTLPDGRQRLVRHGHAPERKIQTGIGPIDVKRPKVRDRADVPSEEKIRVTSAILPKWARRSKSLDTLLPVLYLRGISTGDFQEVLAALLGKDAPNLSPSVIARLTASWDAEYKAWKKRDGFYLTWSARKCRIFKAGRSVLKCARHSKNTSRPNTIMSEQRASVTCSSGEQVLA
jgi:transposase-like protein